MLIDYIYLIAGLIWLSCFSLPSRWNRKKKGDHHWFFSAWLRVGKEFIPIYQKSPSDRSRL